MIFFLVVELIPFSAIEPGLYVPPHDSFPNAFHNLAIRVEDEVLIREDDYVILSVDAPKEVCDIEFAMQR